MICEGVRGMRVRAKVREEEGEEEGEEESAGEIPVIVCYCKCFPKLAISYDIPIVPRLSESGLTLARPC